MSASVSVTRNRRRGQVVVHQAHDRAGRAECPHGLDTASVREQGVVIGLIQLAGIDSPAGGEVAVAIAVADETGDLVDGEPVRDAIASRLTTSSA